MVTTVAVSAVVLFLLWIVSGYLPTMNIPTPAVWLRKRGGVTRSGGMPRMSLPRYARTK